MSSSIEIPEGWTDLRHITAPAKVKAPRLTVPDSVVTTTQAERDEWAVKTLLRKQMAGEVLTGLQLALVERVAPGSAARAAIAAASPSVLAVGMKRERLGEVPGASKKAAAAIDAAGGRGLTTKATVSTSSGSGSSSINAEDAAKASARAARFAGAGGGAGGVVDTTSSTLSARALRFANNKNTLS